MPADITLKVGADTTAYVANVSKMNDAHERVNKTLGKHVELNEVITHGLQRHFFHAFALIGVFDQITEAISKSKEKMIELDKKLTETRMKSAPDLVGLFGAENIQAIQNKIEGDTGISTQDQRNAFLSKLTSVNQQLKEKHRAPLSRDATTRLFNAYVKGGDIYYGPGGEDLLNLVKPNHGGEADLQNRMDALVRSRFNLSDKEDPMTGAFSRLPESYREMVYAQNRATVNAYQNTMTADSTGADARAREREEALQQLWVHHPIQAMGQRFKNFMYAIGNGFENGVSEMYKSVGLDPDKDLRDIVNRKTIHHDSKHSE